MRFISIVASTFLFAAAAIPLVAAAEDTDEDEAVKQFCARLDRVKKPTHLLQLLVELGVIKKPTWTEAEKLERQSSGNLGITSTSFNVPKIDAIQCVVLMSRSDDKDFNPTITAITVQTKRELITYHLGDKGYFEKFRSGRQGPEPEESPAKKITKPNNASLRTPGRQFLLVLGLEQALDRAGWQFSSYSVVRQWNRGLANAGGNQRRLGGGTPRHRASSGPRRARVNNGYL